MSSEVIKEFLVALGFKVDATSEKKFQKAIETAALKAQLLADAIEAIAKQTVDVFKKIAVDVEKSAAGFEKLYYASVRMQSSAANIRDMGKAAEQLGSSADAAGGSLLSFTNTLKALPGAEGLLNGLGVSTRVHGKIRDHEQVLEDFIRKTGKMPTYLAMQYRQMFGIDEGFAQAINSGEWDKIRARTVELRKKVGLDPNQAAKDSRTFMQGLRDVGNVAQAIFERIESRYYSRFGTGVSSIADMLANNADAIIKKITPVIDKFVDWLTDPQLPKKLEEFGSQVWEVAKSLGRFAQWVAAVVPGGGGSIDNGDGTTSRHPTIARDAPRSGKGSYQQPFESRDQSKPGTFYKGTFGQTLFNDDWIEEKKVDGKRAKGGPADAGKTYLVGEEGPELLHMGGQSGTVIPNGGTATDKGGKKFAEAFGDELARPDGVARRFADALGEGLISKMRLMFGISGGIGDGAERISSDAGGVHIAGTKGGGGRRRGRGGGTGTGDADAAAATTAPLSGKALKGSSAELVAYIRESAIKHGIDPDIALRVARSEGGLINPYRHGEGPAPRGQDPRLGSKENSYGPFQLWISGRGKGLGDRALRAGVDPRINWKAGIDFALAEVRRAGWDQWYGAQHQGIRGKRGVGPLPRSPLRTFGKAVVNSPSMQTGNVRDGISAPPAGSMPSGPVSNDNRVTNTIAPNTTITVNGAGDANATAAAVEHAQRRVHSHLLRNAQGAAQ